MRPLRHAGHAIPSLRRRVRRYMMEPLKESLMTPPVSLAEESRPAISASAVAGLRFYYNAAASILYFAGGTFASIHFYFPLLVVICTL